MDFVVCIKINTPKNFPGTCAEFDPSSLENAAATLDLRGLFEGNVEGALFEVFCGEVLQVP
jgi:hypothetical protein